MTQAPEQKIAIVTGAASGIGLAIAQHFARDEMKVALFDLDGAAAEARASELEASGHDVVGLPVDVADRTAVDRAVADVRERWGPVAVLVNNAGRESFRRFLDLTLDEWHSVLDVNLTGTFNCCQIVVPDMIEAGWGRIVNISSSSTHGGQPFMAAYVAAKSGVVGLTKSLALELGGDGVTVNTIPPGFIDTPMTRRNAEKGRLGPGGIEAAIERTPVGRAGRPEDIAAACGFLVSEEAGYVTGQIIGVNGGRNT